MIVLKLLTEGWKTIEMRLNDEKRLLIIVNDVIEFTNTTTNETYVLPCIKMVHLCHNRIHTLLLRFMIKKHKK